MGMVWPYGGVQMLIKCRWYNLCFRLKSAWFFKIICPQWGLLLPTLPPPTPQSAWFWINLSTPIPNHHHTYTHTCARAHTARMEEHVTKSAMFYIDSKWKWQRSPRYNSYNYYITLANLCGEDPLQISLILGKWDYRGMCNFFGCCLKT